MKQHVLKKQPASFKTPTAPIVLYLDENRHQQSCSMEFVQGRRFFFTLKEKTSQPGKEKKLPPAMILLVASTYSGTVAEDTFIDITKLAGDDNTLFGTVGIKMFAGFSFVVAVDGVIG